MRGQRAIAATFLAVALQFSAQQTALGAGQSAKNDAPIGKRQADLNKGSADFELYLDRLMMAESGGRDHLKNPRSSALGPYQFIKSTFLWVVRRHFADEVAGLAAKEILALRTDRAFSRKVIAVYTHELARHLDRHGLSTTYGNLRLAYFLGPSGATRVLRAKPDVPLRRLVSAEAIAANPFLSRLTAEDIIARAQRDISMDRSKRLAVARRARREKVSNPRIDLRCNLARASCRRWLALKKKKLRKEAEDRAATAQKAAAN